MDLGLLSWTLAACNERRLHTLTRWAVHRHRAMYYATQSQCAVVVVTPEPEDKFRGGRLVRVLVMLSVQTTVLNLISSCSHPVCGLDAI